jgi:hypothetical protein
VAQQTVITPTRTRRPIRKQARPKSGRHRGASGQPEARHAVRGFSLFINPNATRIARAAFRFDTGHSL